MNNDNLAPVYLDNKPITLKDAKPKVSAILSAFGKTETTQVKWLKSQSDTQGKALRAEEVIDRTTEPTKAIYLTSSTKEPGLSAGAKGAEAKSMPAGGQQFQTLEKGEGRHEGRAQQSEARGAPSARADDAQAKGRQQTGQTRDDASESDDEPAMAEPRRRDDEKVAGDEDVEDVQDDDDAAGSGDDKSNKPASE